MTLDRNSIKNGLVQEIVAEGERLGLLQVLSPEERLRSRQETMRRVEADEDVWVFGYGSLMWNPAFHYVEQRPAKCHGYHRSFCLSTPVGRGSPDCPGLVLGLDRGGSCAGIAFRIAADQVDEELDLVWRREMVAGSYVPTWVRLATGDGPVNAIAFVIDRTHGRYAGRLSLEQAAAQIAAASGPLGPCSDYLANTVAALDALGIGDGPMHRLLELVEMHQAGCGPDLPEGDD